MIHSFIKNSSNLKNLKIIKFERIVSGKTNENEVIQENSKILFL